MKLRWIAWIFLLLALVGVYYYAAIETVEFNAAGDLRAVFGVIAGTIGVSMVFLFPKATKRNTVILILLASLVVRLAVLPGGASDDVNRYLWEGKLYAQDVSPYTEVAFDESYAPYRDQFWEKMNHRDKYTAYPPLSMHFFSLINSFSYSYMSYKVAFMIIDLFLIAVLLATLHQLRRPLHWALFYALSPISILAFSGEGHFDVIMVFFIALSVFAFSKKWFILCGAAMGLAVASKLMVAILAPIILIKTGARGIIAAAIACFLPFLLHYEDSVHMLNGLISFGAKNNFNGLFNQICVDIIGIDKPIATKICGGLFVVSWFVAFAFALRNRLWPSIYFSLGGLLLFSPIIHFWYLTWILPFIALRPSLPWITFSVTMPLYFIVHSNYGRTGHWELPIWAEIMFYLPFVLFSIINLPQFILSSLRQLKQTGLPLSENTPPTWSVIIPVFKIDQHLQKVIQNLETQTILPQEIVITSANPDEDLEISSEKITIKTTHSPIGRGLQIKTGVEAATQNWCLVLHADNHLPSDSFAELNHALHNNSEIIGGSLGQRFQKSNMKLLLIEAMNEFRATLLHTSFGDQNQFFHRETALKNNILTDQPLMEDVEMSDRLSKLGETLHLAQESSVSAEKWKSDTFWKRFFTIIGFYARYRMFFYSKIKRADLSKSFYKKYYPSNN